ncbi:MAG: sigma-70 family RNA polymerase sigma factor [Eubacteriales bacterium]
MFQSEQQYKLHVNKTEKGIQYTVSFHDGTADRLVEVSKEVAKSMFSDMVKIERNLQRWDERHIDHFVGDAPIGKIRDKSAPLDQQMINKELMEHLDKSCDELPAVQKRRLKMYFYEQRTLEEIAELEGCSPRAVKYSIDLAKATLKKNIKNF